MLWTISDRVDGHGRPDKDDQADDEDGDKRLNRFAEFAHEFLLARAGAGEDSMATGASPESMFPTCARAG